MRKIATTLTLLCMAAFAQQKGSFEDPRDGRTYKTVKIGTQTWVAENLDYAGKNDDIGVCYGKEPKNCKKYGALYNWDEAMKICPPGWHLPSDEEWQTLIDFAGGDEIAGKKLKAKTGWKEYECKYTTTTQETTGRGNVNVIVTKHNKCATDEYGFSALPGGRNDDSDGFFAYVGINGYWWSSSEYNSYVAYYRRMGYNYEGVDNNNNNKSYYLFSVRCLQD